MRIFLDHQLILSKPPLAHGISLYFLHYTAGHFAEIIVTFNIFVAHFMIRYVMFQSPNVVGLSANGSLGQAF